MPDSWPRPARLMGVPFSAAARDAYRAALLHRAGDDHRKGIEALGRYLDITAGRAGALMIFVGLLLVAALGLSQSTASLEARTALSVAALLAVASIALLYTCLWISWQPDPKIYQDAEDEFQRTADLLYDRSLAYNAAMAVSAVSIGLLCIGAML